MWHNIADGLPTQLRKDSHKTVRNCKHLPQHETPTPIFVSRSTGHLASAQVEEMASLTAWTVSTPTCRPAAAAKPLALVQGQTARHSCSVRRRSNSSFAKSGVHSRRQISLQVSAQDTKTEAGLPPSMLRSLRPQVQQFHISKMYYVCLQLAQSTTQTSRRRSWTQRFQFSLTSGRRGVDHAA